MAVEGIKQVGVIGAGMMGLGIGIEFARFGCEVRLYNTKQATSRKAMTQAREDLNLMVEAEVITKDEADATYARLYPTVDFVQAATDADYVIESAPEFLNLKQQIFTKLDEICPPPTILATNTSGLKITDIASKAKHPERMLVTHYFGPPHFIPLVEVVGGARTDRAVVERTARILRALRKKVVVFDIELPQHGANRIQNVMSREIHWLVDQGIPPNVVDDLITYGFGRRLPFIGYFERMDIVGLDARMERYVAAGQTPWGPMVEHIKKGEVGAKAGKGFYEWPPGKDNQVIRRLHLELLRLMKQDLDRGRI